MDSAYLFSVTLTVFSAASLSAVDNVEMAAHSPSTGTSVFDELAKAHVRFCNQCITMLLVEISKSSLGPTCCVQRRKKCGHPCMLCKNVILLNTVHRPASVKFNYGH